MINYLPGIVQTTLFGVNIMIPGSMNKNEKLEKNRRNKKS